MSYPPLPWPRALGGVVSLPGAGRHTITASATDAAGRVVSAAFTRTVALDRVTSTATPLPNVGAGATAAWVHSNGTVAGAVVTPAGRRRPARWRGGQLTVVPATDSLDAAALLLTPAAAP